MTSRNKTLSGISFFVIGLALVPAVSGCSADTDTPSGTPGQSSASTTTVTPATLTASRLQPPPQDNDYTKSSGKPKVVFDPCTWIPDSAFVNLKVDPSTRERGNDIVAEYTFLTCHVGNAAESLRLDSGNVTLDEVRQKYSGKTRDVTVNGRKAVLTPEKTGDNECSVDIETKAGYFGLTDILSTQGIGTGINPCDRATEMAKTLEPYIGKDN